MSTLAHGDKHATESYQRAAALAEKALKTVAQAVKSGAYFADLVQLGDDTIGEASSGQLNKGICHPCCVMSDPIITGYASNERDRMVAAGDLVKIQIGAQVDGHGVVVGKTMVCPGGEENAPDKKEIIAFNTELAKEALKLIKAGVRTWDVTEKIQARLQGSKYGGCIGLPSHNHTKNDIQGPKTLHLFPTPEQRADPANDCVFEEGEVWSYEVWINNAQEPTGVPAPEYGTTLYLYRGGMNALDLSTLSSDEARLAAKMDKLFGSFPFNDRELGNDAGSPLLLKIADRGHLDIYTPCKVSDPSASIAISVGGFIVEKDGVRLLNSKVY